MKPGSARAAGAVASVRVALSPGELIDKITILEIKAERIGDAAKLNNVRIELDLLRRILEAEIPPAEGLDALMDALREVNAALWKVEDDLRECERAGRFDARFVALARAVYRTNDRRAALKKQINTLLGAEIVEEKSYAAY
jgi:hypothetical protein